jgi:ADP-ribose pyrophosphatase YjhB (NUDIX family)
MLIGSSQAARLPRLQMLLMFCEATRIVVTPIASVATCEKSKPLMHVNVAHMARWRQPHHESAARGREQTKRWFALRPVVTRATMRLLGE